MKRNSIRIFSFLFIIICLFTAMVIRPDRAYAISKTNVSCKNTSNGITVNWTAAKGAKGYRVYRKAEGSGSYTLVSSIKSSSKSYVDKTAASGKTYEYKVRAYDAKNTADSTETITRLKAATWSSIKSEGSGLKLTWNSVAGADVYRVYRMNSKSKSYELITTTSNTTYQDSAVTNKQTYKYYVVPVNDDSVGVTSATKSATYAKPSYKCGDSGCVVISSAKIEVPLYAGCSQAIVDKIDSAAYFNFNGCQVIADHSNQNNFSNLYNIKAGDKLTIYKKDGSSQEYTCVVSAVGWNRGSDMTDRLGNSITKKYAGSLIVYTCRGSYQTSGASSIQYTVWK